MGSPLSFSEFLIERQLVSRVALSGLVRNLKKGRPPLVTSVLGEYELVQLLGEGEYGSVFLGQHVVTQQTVAIKILCPLLAEQPEYLARFHAEAAICSTLSHPHIVRFLGMAKTKGLEYIIMEYLSGGSLRQLLASKGGPLDEKTVLRIGIQIADALENAHRAGLVHGDVKPGNILLTRDSQAKLADLGLACPAAWAARTTSRDEFWGTPAYLAPEIIAGAQEEPRPPDPRTDLYSLGITLFELLAGQPPYTGNTPLEVLRKHIEEPIPFIRTFSPHVSQTLEAALIQLLAKKPADRFQDAGTLRNLLDQIANPIQTPDEDGTTTTTILPKAHPSSRRPKMGRLGLRRGRGG
jgi:serine/threonine-protein kinase